MALFTTALGLCGGVLCVLERRAPAPGLQGLIKHEMMPSIRPYMSCMGHNYGLWAMAQAYTGLA
jgi:hypothetical protein